MPLLKQTFADIILPFPLEKAFTYAIPDGLIEKIAIGNRVLVQFGAKKIFTGIVSRIHHDAPEKYKAKEIIDILDENPVVSQRHLNFWNWMASYYCCSVGEVMAAALPSAMKLESESLVMLNPEYTGEGIELSDNEYFVTEALEYQREMSYSQIQEILGVKNIMPVVKSLYLKGILLPAEEVTQSYKAKKETVVRLNPVYTGNEALRSLFDKLEKAPRQLELVMALHLLSKENAYVAASDLLKKANSSSNVLAVLTAKGILETRDEIIDRTRVENLRPESFDLNAIQQEALEKIRNEFKDKNVVLLHGITSSGKTYLYMKLMEEIIRQGRQVLYLLPEIALTAQLIRKLQGYFGNQIGIYHSKYSANERYEVWHKVLNGDFKAVLGVRAALFLPFHDLGLVIVDEEHENTFKQQDPAPRYHARDAAIYLSSLFNAKTLLGTATPSLESYHNAKSGKYGLVTLNKRFTDVLPPLFILSDLKEAQKKKMMKGHLSQELFTEMQSVIERGDQVILFQNRRGYAPYLECFTCGYIPKCKHCDISLTYHKNFRQLRCHYCGYRQSMASRCDSCGNPSLLMKSFGTEKIEDDLSILFPGTKAMRMDMDTTRTRKAYQNIISGFEKGDAQILVGTQMVTKGLDFEKVKLVAILNANQMLGYPDFRSAERTFQLITQVGGRSGRRQERGKVYIQTYSTDHPIFQFISDNNYEGFFNYEYALRHDFNYPPHSRLIRIILKHKDYQTLIGCSQYLGNQLKTHFQQRVLGPESPPNSRLKNEYLNVLLLKFEKNNAFIARSKTIVKNEINLLKTHSDYRKVKIIIDVDPY